MRAGLFGGELGRSQGDLSDILISPLTELDREDIGSAQKKYKVKNWLSNCSIGFSLPDYPTGESLKEVLWRIFCWNVNIKGKPLQTETEDSFDDWYYILSDSETVEEYRQQMRIKKNSFEIYISTRRPLCTNRRGYLASVPYTTEDGDCIFLLARGDVPFILRPTGDYYLFIGPYYVHGIMNG